MKSKIPACSARVRSESNVIVSQPARDGFESVHALEQAEHDEMLCRAYSIWDCKGRPGNSQLADWLQAETEVLGER